MRNYDRDNLFKIINDACAPNLPTPIQLEAWWNALQRYELAECKNAIATALGQLSEKSWLKPGAVAKILASRHVQDLAPIGGCLECHHKNPSVRCYHWLKCGNGLNAHLHAEFKGYKDEEFISRKTAEIRELAERHMQPLADQDGNPMDAEDCWRLAMLKAQADRETMFHPMDRHCTRQLVSMGFPAPMAPVHEGSKEQLVRLADETKIEFMRRCLRIAKRSITIGPLAVPLPLLEREPGSDDDLVY